MVCAFTLTRNTLDSLLKMLVFFFLQTVSSFFFKYMNNRLYYILIDILIL